MKICFASDLHTDISSNGGQPPIRWPEADVLVIAGDTSNSIGEVEKFFHKNRGWPFAEVLFVDGNHEHYSNAPQGRSLAETNARLEAGMPEGVHFLPTKGAVKIGEYYFVGRNGWYSFDSSGDPIVNRMIWREEMNDDRWIGFQREEKQPWELADLHASEMRQIIDDTIASDPDAKFVMVTHTAPHRQMVSMEPRFMRTNPFYINTRMEQVMTDFADRIAVWAHGHTHHRNEKTLNGVYVIANPRGYPGENPSWEPVVIDI
jgi:Icc-related predicted phosphoesterase